jgi:hypothetical protein
MHLHWAALLKPQSNPVIATSCGQDYDFRFSFNLIVIKQCSSLNKQMQSRPFPSIGVSLNCFTYLDHTFRVYDKPLHKTFSEIIKQ